MCALMISTMPRSTSAGKSIGMATGDRPRPTARRGLFRSRESSLWSSAVISSRLGTVARLISCSRRAQAGALQLRNVSRALREAQTRAMDTNGRPAFPILHQMDATGRHVPVPRGSVPSMHSFRHTVASRALLAGESVDEVAFLLGHRDGTVTRTVYVREVADARRRTMRRSRIATEFAGALSAALGSDAKRDG